MVVRTGDDPSGLPMPSRDARTPKTSAAAQRTMAVHLSFAAAGHSRVSEFILAGRTGYWLCDPDRVLAHGVVKLYERHPEGGDFDLNDSVVGP